MSSTSFTSHDDQAAFKPIIEEVGKAPTATASTVPMDSNDDSNESLKETPSSSSSPPKPSIPLPSIDTSQLSTIAPLIFVLKTNLAKLEEELHRKNGGQMKQTLEVLFGRLATSSDLDHVIEALDTLNRILSEDFVYSYEPFLKVMVDRIVLLCARQYRLFFTDYLKTVDLKNPKQVNRIQKFIEENTKVVRNLLVVDHSKHGAYVSREALHELMRSIVPFLVGLDFRSNIYKPLIHSINFRDIWFMTGNLFDGYDSEADNYLDENLAANPSGLVVKAVVLRLLRDFIVDSRATKDIVIKQQANQSIDALTSLIELNLYDFYPGDDINVTKHLSAVVYEIYSMFELASEMKSSPLDNNNMKVLEKLKRYICSIFTAIGPEAAWSHFEMVDKELTVAGRDPREVALFKYLAGEGYARSSQSEVEVVKDTSDSEVPEQTEFAEIQQQQDPKADTIDSGSDSDVVILDLDDDENGHQIILKPTKVAALKPIEESKVVEISTEEVESFEFLNALEQEESKVVKNVLVSIPKTLETPQESPIVEILTATISSTSSISSLSKGNKQLIYAELQKMHQDLAKSQQMLSELLHKLIH